jgi:hypothetical protein
MESEKIIKEQEFADGFNRGYWLYSYEPEVAKSLMQSEIDNRDDFSTGFAQGLVQAEQEKTLNDLEHLRETSNDQELGIDR